MNKQTAISLVIVLIAGILLGACFYSIISKPNEVIDIQTDTITVYDTTRIDSIVHDSVDRVIYKYRYLTVVDTTVVHDSCLVEVPIEYHHASEPAKFDIYYHGYDAALDSVLVYNKTEFITTTKVIEPNKNLIQLNVSNFNTSVSYSRRVNNFYFGGGIGCSYKKEPVISLQVGYSF